MIDRDLAEDEIALGLPAREGLTHGEIAHRSVGTLTDEKVVHREDVADLFADFLDSEGEEDAIPSLWVGIDFDERLASL